jgi:beta-glucosidase
MERLTLRQKVGQLNQRMLGWQALRPTRDGFELTDAAYEEIDRWDGMGSMYGLFRADAWSGRSWRNGIRPEARAEAAAVLQDAVRAASPEHIGTLLAEEAPHGHQALGGTLLPVNLATGAGWDVDGLEEVSAAVASELAVSGVHLALVSALDVLRDPRWGRSEECFGEDPLLAAELTAAIVRGMQGADQARVGGPGQAPADGVAVVLKHLAAQGEAIGGRNGQSAHLGPHDLTEIHLPPVRAGVEAGALGFMAAYNDIDGVPCCADPELLDTFLRDELGFDGIVMADMGAVDRLAEMTGDLAGAARAALGAGVDMSLCDRSYELLAELAAQEPQVAAAVDRSCRRVLALKDRFGLLGPDPASVPSSAQGALSADAPGRDRIDLTGLHARTRAASSRLAARSLVLLTNDASADGAPTLPLDPARISRLAVLGPFADDVPALLGDYVPPLPAGSAPSILEALTAAFPSAEVTGADAAPAAPTGSGAPTGPDAPTGSGEPAGASALGTADAAVVVVGGTSHRSYDDEFADNGAIAGNAGAATGGEGVDLADVSLPHLTRDGAVIDQDALVADVRAQLRPGAPLIVVVVAGRPHVLTAVAGLADAVLWTGYPGPEGARAIADGLVGRAEPTGRLPFTLPAHPGVVPVRHNDRQAADGVYRDQDRAVLFPFGHGLRYTDVQVGELEVQLGPGQVEPGQVGDGQLEPGQVRITVRVENRSAGACRITVPVFAHRRGGNRVPRLRELIGWADVSLTAGQSTTVSITVPASAVFAEPLTPSCVSEIQVEELRTTVRPVV